MFNPNIRQCVLFVVWCMNCLTVSADGLWLGGKPVIGVEIEQEKPASSAYSNHSITWTPSLVFTNQGIDRLDLLITAERSTEADGSNLARSLGIRVKKILPLRDHWGMYVQALAGHLFASTERFTYGYTDAAITYEQEALGFMAALRVQRGLDGTRAHDVNKIRLGPSIDLGEHHEVELRWERAWMASTKRRSSDAVNMEYNHKF